MADALGEDRRITRTKLSRATGGKTSQENTEEHTSVARGWVTNSPWQCSPTHRGCSNQNTSRLWVVNVISCSLQSRHESTRLRLIPELKEPLRALRFYFLEEFSTDGTRAIRHMNKSGVLEGIIMLPKRWDSVIEKHGDYIEGLWTDYPKELKVLVKNTVCITFEIASVFHAVVPAFQSIQTLIFIKNCNVWICFLSEYYTINCGYRKI